MTLTPAPPEYCIEKEGVRECNPLDYQPGTRVTITTDARKNEEAVIDVECSYQGYYTLDETGRPPLVVVLPEGRCEISVISLRHDWTLAQKWFDVDYRYG